MFIIIYPPQSSQTPLFQCPVKRQSLIGLYITTVLRCELANHKLCFNGCLDVTKCIHDRTSAFRLTVNETILFSFNVPEAALCCCFNLKCFINFYIMTQLGYRSVTLTFLMRSMTE